MIPSFVKKPRMESAAKCLEHHTYTINTALKVVKIDLVKNDIIELECLGPYDDNIYYMYRDGCIFIRLFVENRLKLVVVIPTLEPGSSFKLSQLIPLLVKGYGGSMVSRMGPENDDSEVLAFQRTREQCDLAIDFDWTKPTGTHKVCVSIELSENMVQLPFTGDERSFKSELIAYYGKVHGAIPDPISWNFSEDQLTCSLLPLLCWNSYVVEREHNDDDYHLYLHLRKEGAGGGELRHFIVSEEDMNLAWPTFLESRVKEGKCSDPHHTGTVQALFPLGSKVARRSVEFQDIKQVAIISALGNAFVNFHGYLDHLRSYLVYHSAHHREMKGFFAPLVPIIQGSGTGKTRSMLELGKQHPVFYLQCRDLPHYPLFHGLNLFTENNCKQLVHGCIVYLRRWAEEWMASHDGNPIPATFDWSVFSDQFKPAVGRIDAQVALWHEIYALGSLYPTLELPLTYLQSIPTLPKFFLVLDEATGLLDKPKTTDAPEEAKPSPFRYMRRAVRSMPNGLLTATVLDTHSKMSNFAPSYVYDSSLKIYGGENTDIAIPIMALRTFDQGLEALFLDMEANMGRLAEWRTSNMKEIMLLGRVMWKALLQTEQGRAMNDATQIGHLLMLAKEKLKVSGTEVDPINSLAALLLLCPTFFVGRSLADHLTSENMALIHGCSSDRSEIQICFYPEPILFAASWMYLESDTRGGNLSAANYGATWLSTLDALLQCVGNGFTNIGDAGEYVSMLILLMACRIRDPETDPLSFSLIKLNDFLSNMFSKAVDPRFVPKNCFLRFSSFYRLDSYMDELSETLLHVCFLRGQAINLHRNFAAVDLIVPIYCTKTKKIGVLCIQSKCTVNPTSSPKKKLEAMKEVMAKYLPEGIPFMAILMNVSLEVPAKFVAFKTGIVAERLSPATFCPPYRSQAILNKLGAITTWDHLPWSVFDHNLRGAYKPVQEEMPGSHVFLGEDRQVLDKFAVEHFLAFHESALLPDSKLRWFPQGYQVAPSTTGQGPQTPDAQAPPRGRGRRSQQAETKEPGRSDKRGLSGSRSSSRGASISRGTSGKGSRGAGGRGSRGTSGRGSRRAGGRGSRGASISRGGRASSNEGTSSAKRTLRPRA